MAHTLGYVNKNLDLHYIELDTFEACVNIPEDLIFVSFREETDHVFDPISKFPFSNIERDIIGLKGSFDMSFVKQSDFRKANSRFCPKLPPHPLEINFIGKILYFNYPFSVDMQIFIGGNWRTDWYGVVNGTDYDVYPGYEVRLHDTQRGIYGPSYIVSGGS